MSNPFKILVIFTIVLFGTTGYLPSAFGEEKAEQEERPLVDRMAQAVVFINAFKSEKIDAPTGIGAKFDSVRPETGTAFSVKHNDRWYIITAKHVISDAIDVYILANRRDGSVGWFPLSEVEKKLPGASWITDSDADLAIHPFSPSVVPGFAGSAVIGKTLYEGRAYLLDRLFSIGFPYQVGSHPKNEHLSPVVKECVVASWPAFGPGRSGENILVDPPLYPGFSGAPVFSFDETPGSSRFKKRFCTLIGIYVGNVNLRGEGFLGRVVPAKDLIDLLNGEKVRKYEAYSKSKTPE